MGLPSAGSFGGVALASCLALVQGLEWVLGPEGQSCKEACAQYDAFCEDAASVWPADASAFAAVSAAVDADRLRLHQLAVATNRTKGSSAFLAQPPKKVCAGGLTTGGGSYDPSASAANVCRWQGPPAPAPAATRGGATSAGAAAAAASDARRCEALPPATQGRFCPCQPRASGTDDGAACTDRETCLWIVDRFLDDQPRAFGLLQVRAERGSLGGGACGLACELPGPCPEGPAKCRYDTYDNAMAAIYYTKRGRLEKAQEILDAFIEVLYPGADAQLRPQTRDTTYVGGPSAQTLTLLASSYNKAHKPQAGNYEEPYVTDGGVDTGNNAWVALAFAHYAAEAQAACYATVARDILAALRHGRCHDDLAGFLGHLPPYKANYRATEHNIDVFALAKVLGSQEDMAHAHRFVHSMYGQNREDEYNSTWSTGTAAEHHCDYSVAPGAPVASDATFWNLLANADPNEKRVNEALRFAFQRHGELSNGAPDTRGLWQDDLDLVWRGPGEPPKLTGTRFSTLGNGVHWENTAGAVMAMVHYQETYGRGLSLDVPTRLEEARGSLRRLLGMYGGIPSSVLGGNYGAWQSGERRSLFPGGTDTGMGWPYLRYLATAPTAWAGLMLLQQADSSELVDEGANPFAVPRAGVPAETDTTCLPIGTAAVYS